MLDVMILCIQCDFEQLNISCLYKFSFHLPSCVGRVFSGVCVFVCLSVFPDDISKTDAARITKLDQT